MNLNEADWLWKGGVSVTDFVITSTWHESIARGLGFLIGELRKIDPFKPEILLLRKSQSHLRCVPREFDVGELPQTLTAIGQYAEHLDATAKRLIEHLSTPFPGSPLRDALETTLRAYTRAPILMPTTGRNRLPENDPLRERLTSLGRLKTSRHEVVIALGPPAWNDQTSLMLAPVSKVVIFVHFSFDPLSKPHKIALLAGPQQNPVVHQGDWLPPQIRAKRLTIAPPEVFPAIDAMIDLGELDQLFRQTEQVEIDDVYVDATIVLAGLWVRALVQEERYVVVNGGVPTELTPDEFEEGVHIWKRNESDRDEIDEMREKILRERNINPDRTMRIHRSWKRRLGDQLSNEENRKKFVTAFFDLVQTQPQQHNAHEYSTNPEQIRNKLIEWSRFEGPWGRPFGPRCEACLTALLQTLEFGNSDITTMRDTTHALRGAGQTAGALISEQTDRRIRELSEKKLEWKNLLESDLIHFSNANLVRIDEILERNAKVPSALTGRWLTHDEARTHWPHLEI